MRKKILWVLAGMFFGVMVVGTLFHQNIDGLFREQVVTVQPLPYTEKLTQSMEIDGEMREIIMEENYLLLPKEAVNNNMVYVLETVEVPYGSYKVVRLKSLEGAGETKDGIKVKRGIKETDRVVSEFSEKLEDGERVVEK